MKKYYIKPELVETKIEISSVVCIGSTPEAGVQEGDGNDVPDM